MSHAPATAWRPRIFHNVVAFFKTGTDKPPLEDQRAVARIYKRTRTSVLLSVVLGYGFFYTCRLSLSVAKAPMLDAGVLDASQLGIVGAAFYAVYAFGKLTNGFLSDRANIRRFIASGLLFSSLVNLAFGACEAFWVLVLLWGINGWLQSMGSAPSVVSICQWFSNKERGTRYGLWAGSHNIGEGLTFVFTSLIVSALGWRWGFFGPGLVCLVVALILFRTLSDRPETYGLPNVADFKQDYSAGKPRAGRVWELQLQVLKNPAVLILGLSSAMMYVGRYAINDWAMLYLQKAKHYTLLDAGIVTSASPVLGLLGAWSSGYISDRFFGSRRNVPTLFYGLLQVGSLVMLYLVPPGNSWLDAVAIGLFGFAVGGLIVFLAGLTAVDICSKRVTGAVKGIIGLFSYIGVALQNWISGTLIDRGKTVIDGATVYDFDGVFAFWIGATVLSLLLATLVWNVKPRE